ncbi:MAG: hypothetical protein AAF533_29750 [Acidobacteriota bacterium]
MSESSTTSDSRHSLRELRRLIAGPERVRIEHLEERLDVDQLLAEDVSRCLPQAIRLRPERDPAMATALRGIVEEGLLRALRRDPKAFVEVLFPLLGPMIRRSVRESLQAMTTTLERLLEHGLSPAAFAWRIEALMTRRPFAQVALSHLLRYRVEHLYLIHRETGTLLTHLDAGADGLANESQDQVAGLLTAINDFARDAFGAEKDANLEAFRVGELGVRLAAGPHAFLAAVTRGNPEPRLSERLVETVETVHLEMGEELEGFDGRLAPFAHADELLRPCLITELKPPSPLVSILARALLFLVPLVLLGLLGWGIWHLVQPNALELRAADLAARIDREPGYEVHRHSIEGGQVTLHGHRDPLAEPTEDVLARVADDRLELALTPAPSPDPVLVTRRARRLLDPPATVTLGVDHTGLLTLNGEASHDWVERAKVVAPSLAGVTDLRMTVVDADLARFRRSREELESIELRFGKGSSRLSPSSEGELDRIAALARELLELGNKLGGRPSVALLGFAPGRGLAGQDLRRARATRVSEALQARGLPSRWLELPPGGALDPGTAGTAAADELGLRLELRGPLP